MFSLEGGMPPRRGLLRHGVTALICGSDVLAPRRSNPASRRAGLSVARRRPSVGRVRRLGVHELHDPPLTTVRHPIEAIGKAAVTLR